MEPYRRVAVLFSRAVAVSDAHIPWAGFGAYRSYLDYSSMLDCQPLHGERIPREQLTHVLRRFPQLFCVQKLFAKIITTTVNIRCRIIHRVYIGFSSRFFGTINNLDHYVPQHCLGQVFRKQQRDRINIINKIRYIPWANKLPALHDTYASFIRIHVAE
jgi:hypothetical protein